MPYGEGEWEETLDEGDIYARIDEVLGTRKSGGRHVKFAGDSGNVVEFALTDLNVTLRNAPLAPLIREMHSVLKRRRSSGWKFLSDLAENSCHHAHHFAGSGRLY